MAGLIEFVIIFAGLNLGLGFLRRKLMPGIFGADFLFFAPWLASFQFGFVEGIVTAIILLSTHIITSLEIIQYILFASPAVVLAAYLGSIWQFNGFWPALILYHLISAGLVFASRGFGGKFFIFILFSFIFNIAIYFLYTVIT